MAYIAVIDALIGRLQDLPYDIYDYIPAADMIADPYPYISVIGGSITDHSTKGEEMQRHALRLEGWIKDDRKESAYNMADQIVAKIKEAELEVAGFTAYQIENTFFQIRQHSGKLWQVIYDIEIKITK